VNKINPNLLRSLSIEIDHTNQTSTRKRVKHLFHEYNNIEKLNLTCLQNAHLSDEASKAFYSYGSALTDDLLNSLQMKRNLTELSISVLPNPGDKKIVNEFSQRQDQFIENVPELPFEEHKGLQTPVRVV